MTSKHALIGWQTTDFQSHDERSDENLINAIATGSEAAMRTLYARHHVRIYHFIVRLGCDTDRAEDLVSEVFLTVWLARRPPPGSCPSLDSRPLRRLVGAGNPSSMKSRWIWSLMMPTIPNKRFFTPTDAHSYAA
jgi:hypothetical protein